MSTNLTWLPSRVEIYPNPAACRFIKAEAFLSIALQAYLSAEKEMVPPPGQSWVEEGDTWADAEGFHHELRYQIESRLTLAALKSGDLIERVHPEVSEAKPLTAMAHGCAALDVAVGPAQEADQGRADTPTADPLFVGHQRQQLPELAGSGFQNSAVGAP